LPKYGYPEKYGVVVNVDRALHALRAVLPPTARVKVLGYQDRDVLVELAGQKLRLRWIPAGWPRQVEEALGHRPRPDVIAAPQLSPGARQTARNRRVGWLDESGAAEIHKNTVLIERTGTPAMHLSTKLGWRRGTLAVCEALLVGYPATVSAMADRTGLSVSTVADSLKFLDEQGLLQTDAARGPLSGRHISDAEALLEAYAAAAERLRQPVSVRVGVLWRDPIGSAVEAGHSWDRAKISWAVTSALSAAALAPLLTEVTPMEIYVAGRTPADLRHAAAVAGMHEIDGGRLLLRPFPTPANGTVTVQVQPGLTSVLWPRAYADLRTTGVRGEEAAEHLRREMLNG
jgi:hypothetical protein